MSNQFKPSYFKNKIFISDYQIHKLDSKSCISRYRIVSSYFDYEINQNTLNLLQYIKQKEGSRVCKLIENLSKITNKNHDSINSILYELFSKQILTFHKREKDNFNDLHRNKLKLLWFRIRIINTEKHKEKFKVFQFLFKKYSYITILALFVIVDCYFWYKYFGLSWKKELIFYTNFDYIYIFIIYSLLITFHEIGHISAAIKYGVKTGGIGIAIYYYYPVGYADVHESWNLKLKQRMEVSVAGIFFSLIIMIPIIFICVNSNSRALTDFVIVFHYSLLVMFNPFLKMDGYWLLSDFFGIPNLSRKVQEWLRNIFRNSSKNIFINYPKNIRKSVSVYIVLYTLFMTIFLSIISYQGFKIISQLEDSILTPIYNIINKHNIINEINILFRNTIILIVCLILIKKLFKKLHQKIIKSKNENNRSY